MAVPGGAWTLNQITHHHEARTKLGDKPLPRGVYACQCLSLLGTGKVPDLQAKVRTGLGKPDRPGS